MSGVKWLLLISLFAVGGCARETTVVTVRDAGAVSLWARVGKDYQQVLPAFDGSEMPPPDAGTVARAIYDSHEMSVVRVAQFQVVPAIQASYRVAFAYRYARGGIEVFCEGEKGGTASIIADDGSVVLSPPDSWRFDRATGQLLIDRPFFVSYSKVRGGQGRGERLAELEMRTPVANVASIIRRHEPLVGRDIVQQSLYP